MKISIVDSNYVDSEYIGMAGTWADGLVKKTKIGVLNICFHQMSYENAL